MNVMFLSFFKGFLNTGTLIHSLLHEFQYVAPLLANFEPSITNTSAIFIYNSSKFLVRVYSYNGIIDMPSSNAFATFCYL